MCAWSRKAERGRRTTVPSRLASPRRGRRTARSAGLSPRFVPPFSLKLRCGLTPRRLQLDAWKRAERPTGESAAAGPLRRLRAAPGAAPDVADLRVGRAGGRGQLLLAGLRLDLGDRRVRAFGYPGQLRHHALGQDGVEAGQVLGAVRHPLNTSD